MVKKSRTTEDIKQITITGFDLTAKNYPDSEPKNTKRFGVLIEYNDGMRAAFSVEGYGSKEKNEKHMLQECINCVTRQMELFHGTDYDSEEASDAKA